MTLDTSVTPAKAGAHDVGGRTPTSATMDPGLRRGDGEWESAL